MRNLFLKELEQQTNPDKEIKITLWDKLEDKLFYNPFSIFIAHIIRFIKRLPKYLKVCWKQENWDIDYLYELIEMKLQEFLKAQQEDTWHLGTEKRERQIKICLARLDRYRNWPNYYDYPTEDIKFVEKEDEIYGKIHVMQHDNSQNEEQRQGAHTFEKKNYDKFWKDFLQYHQGWWT